VRANRVLPMPSTDALAVLRSRWLPHLALAIASSAVCLYVLKTQPVSGMPEQPRLIFTLAFVASAWAWSLGLTGAALRFLSGHRPAVRYLADASYWIYLVHLPVVAALQVWVGDWPLHWSLKYPFIVAVSLGLLLISYHWLVRSTVIGRVLNGKAYPRRAASVPVEAPVTGGVRLEERGIVGHGWKLSGGEGSD